MPAPREEILLLGEFCSRFGDYAFEATTDGRLACTLSVGVDEDSPARQFKAHAGIPNEDALLAVADGDTCLLAVADAHFGHEASHDTIWVLSQHCTPIPDTPDALYRALAACAFEPQKGYYESESTLVAAVYNRATGEGFGISFGDSSLLVIGDAGARIVNDKPVTFVTPMFPWSFDPERGRPFSFAAEPGDLVCAFTDGIDQCHYRAPETSVGLEHMQELFDRVGADPEAYARGLTELALAGVEDSPGGQDNIALVVVRI